MNDTPFTLKGRILALDLGEKRHGVAVCDPTRTIAQALTVIKRGSRKEDYARIGTLLGEQKANLLLIGLPITLGGKEGSKAAWVRDYAAELGETIDVPIEFWDEALTTVEAEASLKARGIRGKKKKQRVDAVAAAFILQNYLDATHG